MSLSPTLHTAPAFEAEPPPQWPGGVPGKSTLTSRLAPRTVILRVANPEGERPAGPGPGARDANGVAADADAAVERAATTSGQALPGAIQRRFEASLGADLSSVRIHTGPESAAAAGAVGARAYATGQDIHFAAGAYQPDDPFGMHLLAHEVAHTVQQAGGPATRQHKLEVSAPSDRAEVEADRAADAMVAGARFALSGAAPTLAREAAPTAPGAPAESAGGMSEEDKTKHKRPRLEGQSISAGVLPELGGSLGFSWKDGAKGTLGFEGGKKKEFYKRTYNQQVQFPGMGVGELKGSIEVSAAAKADAAFSTVMTQAPAPYEDGVDLLTVSASGGGSLEAGASGTLKLGVGAGVANVLSITGGGYVAVSATASAGVKVTGSIENVEDQVTGALDVGISGGIEVKAAGGLYIDLNTPGDVYNIYKYELGEATLGKLTVTGGGTVTGDGGLTLRPFAITGECSLSPPTRLIQKRPPTPEEKAKIRAQHPQEGAATGASGNRADDSAAEEEKEVEMSDDELWNGGVAKARAIMEGHVGARVPVQDPHSGGTTVTATVGGHRLAARILIPESERRALAERGRAIDRVTAGQIGQLRQGHVYRQTIMDGTANTVDQVAGRILAGGGYEVDLVAPQVELKEVPMETCKK